VQAQGLDDRSLPVFRHPRLRLQTPRRGLRLRSRSPVRLLLGMLWRRLPLEGRPDRLARVRDRKGP
jgi:hypothetical protein